MELFWNGIGTEKHFLGFGGPPFRETGNRDRDNKVVDGEL